MWQNVPNDVLLAWFKFQTKIGRCSGVEYAFRESEKNTPPSPPLSKDEVLKDIGHIMSIGNLILNVNSVKVSYLIHYHSLLQNATILLKNATVIAKCDVYYKLLCLT